MPAHSMIANGTITIGHFVILDTGTAGRVVETSTTTQLPWGVACVCPNKVPLEGLETTNAATAGKMVWVASSPDMLVPVAAGGTITRGDFIGTAANGTAVTKTSDKDPYAGIAEQSGVAGDFIVMKFMPGYLAV